MGDLLTAVALVTALCCALSGGVLYAFSSFVMNALGRLAPAEGMAAMQAINVAAITPSFMLPLFAPALGCVVLAVAAVPALDEPHGPWLLTGAVLYLAGVVGLTGGYHVPRNDALAAADPAVPGAAAQWARYRAEWTRANHLRAAAGLAAAAAFVLAAVTG